MLEIISSGKNTQWHSFPIFQTKCSYSHIANEPADFQVFPGHNCFLEINKKSGFELLRTYNKNGTDIIQRVKKRQMDDLYCGATTKTNGTEVALGLSTGFIRMFNVNTGDFLSSKLRPDKIGNSVIALDYSNCDEYLASLYENGDINFYGLKTGVKTDVFRLDGNSTLIRFHPTKRFYLAAASYNGAVTILDTQSKKKVFMEKSAHAAPCRDIAMSLASPDIFASCGYDCNLNIYDIRKRNMVEQSTQPYPLSCVSISACGNFLCTGNLKGDITSFDMRNLKEHLDTKRVHDASVVRVAFVPALSEINLSDKFTESSSMSSVYQTPSVSTVGRSSAAADCPDSFGKFVDLCRLANDAGANSAPSRRDSWLDFGINMAHPNNCSMDSMASLSPSRFSIGFEQTELRLKRMSRGSLNMAAANEANTNMRQPRISEIMPITEERVEDPSETYAKRAKHAITEAKQPSIDSEQTKSNEETSTQSPDIDFRLTRPSIPNIFTCNKENLQNNQQNSQNNQPDIEGFAKFIKDGNISTPSWNHQQNKARAELNSLATGEQNMQLMMKMFGEVVDRKMTDFQTSINSRLDTLETNVMKKVHEAENEIKFHQDHYHHSGFAGNFRLFKLMEKEIDVLKEGISVLMREDVIGLEYYRLKEENEELKRRLEKH